MMRSILVLVLATSMHAYANVPKIEPASAGAHIGQAVVACGVISEVKAFSKGAYLNFGPRFPKEHMTAVVWRADLRAFASKFGELNGLQGRGVCVRGTVSTYKGHVQIELAAPDRLVYSE